MSCKCLKFVCVVLAASVFVAIAGVARAETLLLKDTFNNVTDADTYGVSGVFGVNQELGQSYRQIGTYAGTTYTTRDADGFEQVNNPGLGAGRFAASGGGWVSPNHNFNGIDAAGGLKVSFDMLPQTSGRDILAATFCVSVGADSQGSVLPNPGLGLVFIRSYPWANFDGDVHYYVDNNGIEHVAHYTDTPDVWHNVTLLFTDTVDSNPFNGSGDLRVQGFVDSSTTPFMAVDLSKDFANNYITLTGGPYWNLLDNLTVSQVPEPTSMTLLAMGLIGLLAYAWRKRK